MVSLEPVILPSLFLVSRHFHSSLDRPHALWEAYFRLRVGNKKGYTEIVPGLTETWREVVKRFAMIVPRPFLLLGQPILDCGLVLPNLIDSHTVRCQRCGELLIEHNPGHVYQEQRITVRGITGDGIIVCDQTAIGYFFPRNSNNRVYYYNTNTMSIHQEVRCSSHGKHDTIVASPYPTRLFCAKFIGLF